MDVVDVKLLLRHALKPEDFQVQLYAGLVDDGGRDWLPRVPIVYKQSAVRFDVIRDHGMIMGTRVFDREMGGVPLVAFTLRYSVIRVRPGDSFTVELNWNL